MSPIKKNVKVSREDRVERRRHFIIGLTVLGLFIYSLLYSIFPVVGKVHSEFLTFSSSTTFSKSCPRNNSGWSSIIDTQFCLNSPKAMLEGKYVKGIHKNRKYLWAYETTDQKYCSACSSVDAGYCFRNMSGDIRCLPSFIIAGVMKSGTGELMKWLDSHPFLKAGKGSGGKNEVHFFGEEYEKATCKWSAYVKKFPHLGNDVNEIYTFEKSPDYLRSKTKMQQIRDLLPSVKIIVLLRNPTLRAISEMDHNCRHGRYVKLLKNVTVQAASNSKLYGSYQSQYRDSLRDSRLITLPIGSVVSLQFLEDHGYAVPNFKYRSNIDNEGVAGSTAQSELSEQQLESTDFYSILPYPCRGLNFRDFYFGSSPTIFDVIQPSVPPAPARTNSYPYQTVRRADFRALSDHHSHRPGPREVQGALRHSNHNRALADSGTPQTDLIDQSVSYNPSSDSIQNITAAAATTPTSPIIATSTAATMDINVSSPFVPMQSGTAPVMNRTTAPQTERIFVPVLRWSEEELSHGFYDDQLLGAFELFPPQQILILFQEDMLKDTYATLRKVESFLDIPCFDYAAIASSTSDPGRPPRRKPQTMKEKLSRMQEMLFGKIRGSELLQLELPAWNELTSSSSSSKLISDKRQAAPNFSASKSIKTPLKSIPTRASDGVRITNSGCSEKSNGTPSNISALSHTVNLCGHDDLHQQPWVALARSNYSDLRWVRAAMDDVFRPHNRRLAEILKRKFNIQIPRSWPQ